MKNTLSIIAIIMLMIWGSKANAQLLIDGEFRTRGIVDHGYFKPVLENTDAIFSVDQRTRLNVLYNNEKFSTKISIQDSRLWGGDDAITKTGAWGNTNSLGLHEAWFNLKLNDQSNLKIGRQEWNYDDMRLLSYRNWLTSALSHDGLLYQKRFIDQKLDLDLGLSYNNNGTLHGFVDNSNWPSYKIKTLNFLRIKKALRPNSYVAFISTLAGREDAFEKELRATGTHGFILKWNKGKTAPDGFMATLEGYYQHGKDITKGSNGDYRNISSYMINADFGFRTMETKLEVLAGFEYISGHDYSNTDEDYQNTKHSFDMLYGGRFPYFGGYMNHFVYQDSYSAGTKAGGYADPFVKIKYKLNKTNFLEAMVYSPILTTKVAAHTSINPETKKPAGKELDEFGNPVYWNGNLGQYIDLVYTRKISKEIVFKTGLSTAIPSDIKNQMVYGYKSVEQKQLNELGNQYFGWVMISVKPTFFKSN